MIVAAALQYAHITLSMPKPARHHDVLHQLYGMLEDANEGKTNNIANIQAMCVQGFIDDQGNFLDRREAFFHTKRHGPGTPRRDALLKAGRPVYDGAQLFSEDIW